MKARFVFILAVAILVSACSEHFCPAYGSHSSTAYSYKSAKKKTFKTKSVSGKKVRQAERE